MGKGKGRVTRVDSIGKIGRGGSEVGTPSWWVGSVVIPHGMWVNK